jgi:hypothetical protein
MASPTPIAIGVQFSYSFAGDQFVLKWQSQNAASMRLDDQPAPLAGAQTFPLQTHTFVLTATGADGSQSLHVISFVMINACAALINGQQTAIQSEQCAAAMNQAQPSATAMVPATGVGAPGAPVPAATSTPQPTETAMVPTAPSGGSQAADGSTAAPATATATADLGLPTFPTDTPTPTFTGGQ